MISRESLKAIRPIRITYYFYKYLVFQLKLIKARFYDWRDGQNNASMPIPPAELRYRVHGSLDKESFIQNGKNLAQNIRDLCALAEHNIYSFENVLDFGCGCGRVLQNFQDAPRVCQFYGTDIDSELISWGEKYLPNIKWSTNGYHPPLPFADNTFDLIYAISVFTHIDEEFQHMWLSELQRIVKVRGIIILTVHGESTISKLAPSNQIRIHSYGFMFETGSTGSLKLDKLPDFYQTAYHTKEYIYRDWSAYFDVLHYLERGINNHQDAVILRKR